MACPIEIDPFAPETIECPYGFYDELRRGSPVYEVPGAGYFLVSRMEDVRSVVRNPDLFSSNLVAALFSGASGELLEARARGPRPVDVLATVDPPAHTRQRRLVNPAFNVRRIEAMEARIRALAVELIQPMSGRARIEWMREFAVPLPVTVIAEVLGLPRADVSRLASWSDHAVALLSGRSTSDQMKEHVAAIAELQSYLAARFTEARGGPATDSMMGDLVRAVGDPERTGGHPGSAEEVDRAASSAMGLERLSNDEVVAILGQLLIAGNETTTSLIGSAVRILLERDDVRGALLADRMLIPPFLEEVLRLESPFQGHFRVATRATELGGVAISAGSRLLLGWGAANRDPDAVSKPDEIDLTRDNPKAHLGFGEGIHYCVGAPLARLEARIGVESFLQSCPNARLAPSFVPRHLPSVFVRRLAALEILL